MGYFLIIMNIDRTKNFCEQILIVGSLDKHNFGNCQQAKKKKQRENWNFSYITHTCENTLTF